MADPESAGALFYLVPLKPLEGRTSRVNITLDEYLLAEIDAAAKQVGSNRSKFLAAAARKALDNRRRNEPPAVVRPQVVDGRTGCSRRVPSREPHQSRGQLVAGVGPHDRVARRRRAFRPLAVAHGRRNAAQPDLMWITQLRRQRPLALPEPPSAAASGLPTAP